MSGIRTVADGLVAEFKPLLPWRVKTQRTPCGEVSGAPSPRCVRMPCGAGRGGGGAARAGLLRRPPSAPG